MIWFEFPKNSWELLPWPLEFPKKKGNCYCFVGIFALFLLFSSLCEFGDPTFPIFIHIWAFPPSRLHLFQFKALNWIFLPRDWHEWKFFHGNEVFPNELKNRSLRKGCFGHVVGRVRILQLPPEFFPCSSPSLPPPSCPKNPNLAFFPLKKPHS